MNAARELVLATLRREGGEVRDPADAVGRLLDLLRPNWTKRDSLVHLLLDMERDGLIERERPSARRTTAVRLADDDVGCVTEIRTEEMGRLTAVEILLERMERMDRTLLSIHAAVLEVHASLLRQESPSGR